MFMLPKIHIFPFKKMRRIIIQFLFSLVNSSAVKHNFSDMKKNQKIKKTYKPRTQRVTWRPLSRHFSGLGSFCLHFKNSTFSCWHLNPMCLDDAVSTADDGIGSPLGSTAVAISNRLSSKK